MHYCKAKSVKLNLTDVLLKEGAAKRKLIIVLAWALQWLSCRYSAASWCLMSSLWHLCVIQFRWTWKPIEEIETEDKTLHEHEDEQGDRKKNRVKNVALK